MGLKPDRKYDGKIGIGSALCVASTGTIFFQLNLECEDGSITYPIWLTEANKKKAKKQMEIIGADMERLGSASYLENELPTAIVGNEISFDTVEDTYNDRQIVKVSWIRKKTDPNLAKGAANFFGGNTKDTAPAKVSEPDYSNDDIPF